MIRYSLQNINDDGPEVLEMSEDAEGQYIKLEELKSKIEEILIGLEPHKNKISDYVRLKLSQLVE